MGKRKEEKERREMEREGLESEAWNNTSQRSNSLTKRCHSNGNGPLALTAYAQAIVVDLSCDTQAATISSAQQSYWLIVQQSYWLIAQQSYWLIAYHVLDLSALLATATCAHAQVALCLNLL